MNTSTSISKMQKFHFGSKVYSSDGEERILTYILFDQETRCLTHIGVRQGRFLGKVVYFPFSVVADASGDGVRLCVGSSELAGASSDTPDGVVFDKRSAVVRENSRARGTLRLVAVKPENGALAYIVVHHLHSAQDTLIQQEFISQLASGSVSVAISDASLQALPPYRSDEELQREVETAIFQLTPLHVDFRGIKVRVLDSVLHLEGNVSSALRSDLVQQQASGIEGLLEIENHLVCDDVLAGELALALSRDPRTRDLPIGVYPKLGNVRLSGSVRNGQQKAAAEEIARSVPGVHLVINNLVIGSKVGMLHILSSAESGSAEDLVPGKYIRHTK